MSSLLSTTDIFNLTGQFSNHFDTFSQFTAIVINKKPLQTISDVNSNNTLPGYGPTPNEGVITYTPVYESFPCIALYDKPPKPGEIFQEVKLGISQGKVRIKVKRNARDYIVNGPNENVVLNEVVYNLVSEDGVQNYLGLIYYYFLLERTS